MGCSTNFTAKVGFRYSAVSTTVQVMSINSFTGDCADIQIKTTAPWGATYTDMVRKGSQVTYSNPSTPGETVIISCLASDCNSIPNSATLKICHETVEQYGSIKCTTSPTGATTYYDGTQMNSKTNFTIGKVPTGQHTIKFTKTGYRDKSATVTVEAGKTSPISTTLSALIQSTSITLNPLPSSVKEGDQVTFSGTLKTTLNTNLDGINYVFFKDVKGIVQQLGAGSEFLKAQVQSNGSFTTVWNAKQMNRDWLLRNIELVELKAFYGGELNKYVKSESSTRQINVTKRIVEKLNTTLTINPFTEPLVKGMTATLSGRLVDSTGTGVNNAEITFKDQDLIFDTKLKTNATTGPDGRYSINWIVKDLDIITENNEIYAIYKGSEKYNSSKSDVAVMKTGGVNTTLTFAPSKTSGVIEGDTITFTGKLTADNGKSMVGMKVGIFDYDAGLGNKQLKTTNGELLFADVKEDGSYSVDWVVKRVDFWNKLWGPKQVNLRAQFVKAEIDGIGYDLTSSHVSIIDISATTQISILTLNNIDAMVETGSTITLSGELKSDTNEPIEGSDITFTSGYYSMQTDLNPTTKTDAKGMYSVEWTVPNTESITKITAHSSEIGSHRKTESNKIEVVFKDKIPIEQNSITVTVTDQVKGKNYSVRAFTVIEMPDRSGEYARVKLVSEKNCIGTNCHPTFTEIDSLEVGKKYYITAEKYASVLLNNDDEIVTFGTPTHQTITRSVKGDSKLVRKVCELLDIADCDALAKMLTLDMLTPLMDLSAIVKGEDPYTGKPIDDLSWYYVFALLGFGSVATAIPREGIKVLKFSSKGVKIANAARKSGELMEFLKEHGVLTKVLLYSAEQADGFLKAIAKGIPDARAFWASDKAMVDLTKIGDISKNMDEVKIATGMGDEASDAIKSLIKISDDIPTDRTLNKLIIEFLDNSGDIGALTDTQMDSIFAQILRNPNSLLDDVGLLGERGSDTIDFPQLINKLKSSTDTNTKTLGFYLEMLDKTGLTAYHELNEIQTEFIKILNNRSAFGWKTDEFAKVESELYPIIFNAVGDLKSFNEIAKSDIFKSLNALLTSVGDFFHKYTDLLKGIESGEIKTITDAEINEIFAQAKTNYNDIDAILKDTDINSLSARLTSMKTPNGDALDSLLKTSQKIDTRRGEQKIINEMVDSIKIRKLENPASLKDISKGYDDILNIQRRRIPLDNAISTAKSSGKKVDETYNLIDETLLFFETLKITPKMEVPKAVATFIKKTALGVIEFMRRNPKFTMTTAIGGSIMIVWFAMDNLPFYAYMYAKYNGIAPGDPTWVANNYGDTIDKELWNAKNACDLGNEDVLKSSIKNAETKINEYNTYIESERAALTSANQYEINIGILEAFNHALLLVKECIQSEIEIPDDGILTNIFISKIIDGDTVDCRIIEGKQKGESFRIRVVGINTPDHDGVLYSTACSESKGADTNTVWTTKEVYTESIKQMWSLIDDNIVTLHIDPKRKQDSHGRYVALIFKNDIEINLEMIKTGYACYYSRNDFTENLIDHDVYIAARNKARAAGLGIWAKPETPLEFGEVILSTKKEGATSNMSGVAIWINGEYYRPSTTPVKFAPGEYTASFEITGYVTVVKEFTVEKDKTIIIEATMIEGDNEEQPVGDVGYAIFSAFRETSTGGTSTVISTLWLNSNMLNYESDESVKHKFTPGEYTVVFKKTGYANVEKTFTIVKGEDTPVIAKMVSGTSDPGDPDAPSAKIDFITKPSAAEIYLDGAYIGLTKKSTNVSEGTHTVSFKKLNYLSCEQTFTVVANTPQPISCSLEDFIGGEDIGPDGWTTYKPPITSRFSPSGTGFIPTGFGAQQTTTQPVEKNPWELLTGEIRIAIISSGKNVSKQDIIIKETTAFMEKHCDLDIEFIKIEHDFIEPEEEDDCAILNDPKYIEEALDPDKFEETNKIIYLLWDSKDVNCTTEPGFTGSIEETVFDALICTSPTSKAVPEFNNTTGKAVDLALKIKYNGSITMMIQLIEAIHELYHATKDSDSPELPEFGKEFCEKNFVNDRPNTKCILKWLNEFNNAVPDEIKDKEKNTDSKSKFGRKRLSSKIQADILARAGKETNGSIAARHNIHPNTVKNYIKRSK